MRTFILTINMKISIDVLNEFFITYISYLTHISNKFITNKRIFTFRIGSFSLIKQKYLLKFCRYSALFLSYPLPFSTSCLSLFLLSFSYFLSFPKSKYSKKNSGNMRCYFPVICSFQLIHNVHLESKLNQIFVWSLS